MEHPASEPLRAALSDVAQLLVRAPETTALFAGVIDILEDRLDCQAFLGAADRASGSLRRVELAGRTSSDRDSFPSSLVPAADASAFWQGAPQCEADVRIDGAVFQAQCARQGIAAALAVPVLVCGEVAMIVLVRSPSANFSGRAMLDGLQQFASCFGLGLESRQRQSLLSEALRTQTLRARALRLLSEMVKLQAHGQDSDLASACRLVTGTGGYPCAWIGLREDDAGAVLRLAAHDGFTTTEDAKLRLSLAAGSAHAEDAAVIAMLTGQPLVRRPADGGGLVWPYGTAPLGLRAVLTLPLGAAETTLGVLAIGATDPDAFGADEVAILSELATELALGLLSHHRGAARSAAEQDLRGNLQHFQALLANQHAGILVMSQDDRVKFVNAAFCELFGIASEPADLEGLTGPAIYAQMKTAYREPEQQWARIRAILDRGEPVKNEEVAMRGGRIFLRDYTPITIDGAAQGRLWHQREITEQKRHEAKVERLAFYDVITGLPNRRLLSDLLEQARSQAAPLASLLAVGVLDLDRFKSVNDSIGHSGGDHVLAEASSRIQGMLREADLLARIGGDEFALVIPGLDSKEQLDAISRCVLQALRAPFDLMGEQICLSASIGWTLFPLDDSDTEGLLRHADLALYAAKEEGKDRGALYRPEMELEQLRLQAMRERISQALVQSRLRLLFQPIVYIDGLPGLHGVAGMEALLRLQDTEEGLIEPANFMHVLDDPQLARPIGRYVLDEALRQCQAWMAQGISIPVSINISTRHLLHPAFFNDIDAVLDLYPDVMDVGFGIEVTETGPSMDHARAKVVIEECRRRGIRVGLDDFGTGSASLSHIQQLDIEHIKLDQSFVRDILGDERNMAIAAGVITTARMLAKTVIAEGVENAAQGDLLASLGCHQLQGFSISRPMPGDTVPAWIASWVPPDSWGQLVNERQSLLSEGTGRSDIA